MRNGKNILQDLRRLARADAYAKVRHEAKVRAETAEDPAERKVYQEVAEWAQKLELEVLEES